VNRPEDHLQRACLKLAALYRRKGCVFHIPNGGLRSKREAQIMKGLGVLAGAPDLIILGPGGRVAFAELKAPKGRQTQGQKDFEALCKELGHTYRVVYTLGEFASLMFATFGFDPRKD